MSPLGLMIVGALLLALFGGLPHWGYSAGWGYGPSGLIGIVLIVVVVLLLTGRL